VPQWSFCVDSWKNALAKATLSTSQFRFMFFLVNFRLRLFLSLCRHLSFSYKKRLTEIQQQQQPGEICKIRKIVDIWFVTDATTGLHRKTGIKKPIRYDADIIFLEHNSICTQRWARYMSVHPSVCVSVCLSHGWISEKRLKLGSCKFHHRVAQSQSYCGINLIHKFWRVFSWAGPSNKGGGGNKLTCWLIDAR